MLETLASTMTAACARSSSPSGSASRVIRHGLPAAAAASTDSDRPSHRDGCTNTSAAANRFALSSPNAGPVNTSCEETPSRSASVASVRREPRQSGPTRTSAASRSPALRECLDQQVQSLLPRIQSADEHEHLSVPQPGPSVIQRVRSQMPRTLASGGRPFGTTTTGWFHAVASNHLGSRAGSPHG